MKRNVFLGLLAMTLVFGFVNCGGDDAGTTTYTITFNSNGGSTVPAITGITSGSTITLPEKPKKENHDFVGWFTDNNTFSNEFTSSTPVIEDITVFANWEPVIISPFEGKWKGWNGDGTAEKIWQFSGNNFLTIIAGKNNAKGTFSYTETEITATATHFWIEETWSSDWPETFGPKPFVQTVGYTLSGNELTLIGDGDGKPFIKQSVHQIVGTWTKTKETVVYVLTVNADGTCSLTMNGEPYGNNPEHPLIWEGTEVKIWYDYISDTHPEPSYVSAAFTLSEDKNSFTLSGDAELLLLGTEPWTRVE